uniref:Uncharacterized protein n=1 Tax=Arundo donax TaxID=35708 RepID=A0A0A9BN91_ARUDO
MRIEQTLR